MVTAPHKVDDISWYMDSEALDHVTSKMEQLVIKEDYTGCQQLHIGSGEYFKISHKGSIFLPTALSNILKFPKNLLSSSKFTHDNNVTVEFLSNCCFVKDKDTKEVLLQGTLKIVYISSSTSVQFLILLVIIQTLFLIFLPVLILILLQIKLCMSMNPLFVMFLGCE